MAEMGSVMGGYGEWTVSDRAEGLVKNKEVVRDPEKVWVVLATQYKEFRAERPMEELDAAVDTLNNRRKEEGTTEDFKRDEQRLGDDLRGTLALESLRNLVGQGVNVVVVDGGSSEEFKQAAKKVGCVWHDQQESGYSQGRREGMQVAVEESGWNGVVMQIEPEKVALTSPEMLARLVNPIQDGEALMTILDRKFEFGDLGDNPNDWFEEKPGEQCMGYPVYQAKSETWLNRKMTGYLRKLAGNTDLPEYDFLNGTRVFDVRILRDFLNQLSTDRQVDVNPEKYFNAVYFPPFLLAVRGQIGMMQQVEYEGDGDFYPAAQAKLERGSEFFIRRRDDQRRQIAAEMEMAYQYLSARGAGKESDVKVENLRDDANLFGFLKERVFTRQNLRALGGGYRVTETSMWVNAQTGLARKPGLFEQSIQICEVMDNIDRERNQYTIEDPFEMLLSAKATADEYRLVMRGIVEFLRSNPLTKVSVSVLERGGVGQGFVFPEDVTKAIGYYVDNGRLEINNEPGRMHVSGDSDGL